jgi:hypothetical protein
VVMGSGGNVWQSLIAEQRAKIRTDEFRMLWARLK